MARDCGVRDVHALYGVARYTDEYTLLKQVTHWPVADVREEEEWEEEFRPTYALDHSLSQILALFDFKPFRRASSGPSLSDTVEVWKKTIDVQQHFNDIALRIRNVAVTVLVATVGAAAVIAREQLFVTIGLYPALLLMLGLAVAVAVLVLTDQLWRWRVVSLGVAAAAVVLAFVVESSFLIRIPLATLVLGAGAVAWVAFFFMDKYWYHMLLKGAVDYGTRLERDLADAFPEPGLTRSIGNASPWRIGKQQVHSTRKMNWFYGMIFLLMVMFAAASVLIEAAPATDDASPAVEAPGPEEGVTPSTQ